MFKIKIYSTSFSHAVDFHPGTSPSLNRPISWFLSPSASLSTTRASSRRARTWYSTDTGASTIHGCAAGRALVRRHRGGRGHHRQLRGARGGGPGRERAPAGALRPAAPARLVARRVPHHPPHLHAAAVPSHGPARAPPLARRRARRRVHRAHAHPAPRPGAPRRAGLRRRHRQRRRHGARPGGGRIAAGVGGGVQGAGGVGRGDQRAGRCDKGDQGDGHVPNARRQDGRRREGQGGGGRRRQEERTRRHDRGEDVKRRGVPRRQVHHHGGRVGEQAGEVRHRRRPAGAAGAHPRLLLEGEARARGGADDGGRLPDVRDLRRPGLLRHAVHGVPGPDQDLQERRAAMRPGRQGLGHRQRRGRDRGGRGAVDRRVHAGPRGHRRRAGAPAAVHVLHDARRGLRDRLPGRGGVREGRGGRRRVLRPRVQDGPGRREDPRRAGAGRRVGHGGGGRPGARALPDRTVRRQPDGERHESLRRKWPSFASPWLCVTTAIANWSVIANNLLHCVQL